MQIDVKEKPKLKKIYRINQHNPTLNSQNVKGVFQFGAPLNQIRNQLFYQSHFRQNRKQYIPLNPYLRSFQEDDKFQNKSLSSKKQTNNIERDNFLVESSNSNKKQAHYADSLQKTVKQVQHFRRRPMQRVQSEGVEKVWDFTTSQGIKLKQMRGFNILSNF